MIRGVGGLAVVSRFSSLKPDLRPELYISTERDLFNILLYPDFFPDMNLLFVKPKALDSA